MRVGDDVAVLRDDDAAARAVESLLTAVVYIDLNIYDGILDRGYQVSCVGVCAVAVALGSSGGGVVDNAGLKRVQYVLRALGDAAFGSAGACGAVRRGVTLSDWEAPPIRSWLALLAAKAPPNPAPPQSTAIAATMATIFPVRWVLGFFGGCCSVKFISGCVF